MIESSDLFIYVIAAGDIGCKIGVSRDPEKRLTSLKTGVPVSAQLTKTFPLSRSAAFTIEASIHRNLAARRLSGEWFSISYADAELAVRFAIDEFCRPQMNHDRGDERGLNKVLHIEFPNDPLYINKWRKRCGFTQEQAAMALGYSISRFCAFDRAEVRPPRVALLATLTIEKWGVPPDGVSSPEDQLSYYDTLVERAA